MKKPGSHRFKGAKAPEAYTESPISSEERERRAKLTDKHKTEEARVAREAAAKKRAETWWTADGFSDSDLEYEPPEPKTKESTTGASSKFFKDRSESKPNPNQANQANGGKKRAKMATKRAAQQANAEAKRNQEERESHAQYQARLAAQWARYCEQQTRDRTKYGENYATLHHELRAFQADHISNPFPKPPSYGCHRKDCMQAEKLKICHHELELCMRGSGCYSVAWLKKERAMWHPDRFATKGDAPLLANEMFQLFQRLIEGA
jgi:hypothetical protein